MIDETTKCRILDELEEAHGVIVTTGVLLEKTDMSRRELQKAIHELRLAGHLICSTTAPPGGYYLAETPDGAKGFVESMTRRGRAVFAAASAARRFVKKQADGDDG